MESGVGNSEVATLSECAGLVKSSAHYVTHEPRQFLRRAASILSNDPKHAALLAQLERVQGDLEKLNTAMGDLDKKLWERVAEVERGGRRRY